MRTLLSIALACALASSAWAEIKTKTVEYKDGNLTCKGYMAWDDAKTGKLPGVLIVHEVWGLNDYAKKRAEDLAKLGYAAFACDMYGDGKTSKHPEDAMKFMNEIKKNKETWVGRAKAALKTLGDQDNVDPKRLAAIGYCFGGSTVMELAMDGADLKAVATFHGGPPDPTVKQAKAIKAKLLICNGADDKHITADKLEKLEKTLKEAKVDAKFESYKGAVHSFTVPDADTHNMPGIAYNEEADKKSWQALKELLESTLAEKK